MVIPLNIFYVHKYFPPQIKFDPVTPTPPYSEAEYYTTERRNLSLEVRGGWSLTAASAGPTLAVTLISPLAVPSSVIGKVRVTPPATGFTILLHAITTLEELSHFQG